MVSTFIPNKMLARIFFASKSCNLKAGMGIRFLSAESGQKERAAKILKPRALITVNNAPHRVTKMKQGVRNRGGFIKVNIKNLLTGNTSEVTYLSDEMVETCNIDKIQCTFSWREGSDLVLMDAATFEEMRVDKSICDGVDKFLVEGEAVRLLKFQNKPMGIELPNVVELTVVSTDVSKASGGMCMATLNSGATLMVPDFISAGARIKVNTEEETYQEKA